MILFRPEHVQPILDGTKTETRRFWKRCRVKVGSVHQLRTNMPWQGKSGHFADALITETFEQALDHMDDDEARAEGYQSWPEYMYALSAIHRRPVLPTETVWVVRFEAVREVQP